jgi:hypothetical protein
MGKARGGSLAGALAIAPRLVGIHFAHPLQDAAGIGLLHIGRFRAIPIPLLPLPRRRSSWFLRPLWHEPQVIQDAPESKDHHAPLALQRGK